MSATNRRLLVLLVISLFINYIDRGNLSIAAPLLEKELALDPSQIGSLLAAFFWTYALMQLFGIAGWLADRFSVTAVLAWGFFAWTASTALTGLVSGFVSLFIMRLILGAGESVAYPCYSKILARYYPEEQRGLANSLLDAGSKLGPALGTLIGGLLMASYGWRWLFVVLGVSGVFWLIPWWIWRPRDMAEAQEREGTDGPRVADILRHRSAWGTFSGHFCANYFWFFLLTWLPGYLVNERGMSLEAMSVVGSAAYLAIATATVISGTLADRWISRGMSVTRARKTMTITGLTVSTIILPVAIVGDPYIAMALLLVACVGFGIFASSHWAITQTLAGPAAAGRWTSLQNGVGNLAGIAAPWLTGVVLQSTGRFYLAFVVAALIALAGACMYAFVIGRVEPVRFEPRSQAAVS